MTAPEQRSAFTAVILAAGKGTRMKSERPKVLHKICSKSLLELVIRAAREAGARRIVVVVGHERERIRKAFEGEDLIWVVQEPQLGTGHALAVTREVIGDEAGRLVLLYGDVPLIRASTLSALLEQHETCGSRMTVVTARVEDPTGYGRILRDGGAPRGSAPRQGAGGVEGDLIGIREEADASELERGIDEINTGIYAFETPDIFGVIERIPENEKKGEVYLTDAVALIRADGGVVSTLVADDPGEFQGVNSRSDLARAGGVLRGRIAEAHMEAGVTIVDPSTTYIDLDVEIGRDTTIHPCTVIGSGVRIGERCSVGPFTHLRVNTTMLDRSEVGNFTEVKNSTIGEGSKAKHLTYLGDAKLGSKVNIGAGTITANYDGVNKSLTSIGDGAFVGSGTIFVAPSSIEANGVTGAGAVVTRGTEVKSGEVFAGVPAKSIEAKKSRS